MLLTISIYSPLSAVCQSVTVCLSVKREVTESHSTRAKHISFPSSLDSWTIHVHSCRVSRNDRDSPGIFAFVPDVFRLTQKADNVPDFSQTLILGAYIR